MVLRSCSCLDAFKDRNLVLALLAEFVGVGLFQLFGGSLPVPPNPTGSDQPDFRDPITVIILAVGNGLIYAVLVYLTRHVSGGHLNPAVTVAVTASGHMNLFKGLLYVFAQIAGGICGGLAGHIALSGGTHCFDKPKEDVEGVWSLFSWEIIMTFVLIMVIYSSVIAPGHGDVGPFVIGLAVTGCMWAGVPHSGGALNPARVIGPTMANINSRRACAFDVFWYYLASHATAAILAALCALVVHGPGPHFELSRGRRPQQEEPLLQNQAEHTAEV